MMTHPAPAPVDRIVDLENSGYLQLLNLRVTLEYVFSTRIMGTL
jgi:hypothetical protein